MEHTAARPKNGRPLQNLPPTTHGDFVAAVPSRAFRDGTGIFMVKLSHYQLLLPQRFIWEATTSPTSGCVPIRAGCSIHRVFHRVPCPEERLRAIFENECSW